MIIADRIQKLIVATESSQGRRLLWILTGTLAVAGLMLWYDIWSYRGFSAPEAMDYAQEARNLADGHGYATQCISPSRLYLLQARAGSQGQTQLDAGRHDGFYPDLADHRHTRRCWRG
jgi:hypothetical protein